MCGNFSDTMQLQISLFGTRCDGLLAQRYAENHGQVVYKVYVAGENYAVSPGRSLNVLPADIQPGQDPTYLPKVFVKSTLLTPFSNEELRNIRSIPLPVAGEIVKAVRQYVNLTVFGIDVIHCTDTKRYHIVDINFIPSFRSVSHGLTWILDTIRKAAAETTHTVHAFQTF